MTTWPHVVPPLESPALQQTTLERSERYAHTCAYLRIPAHTCAYLRIPAHTCAYLNARSMKRRLTVSRRRRPAGKEVMLGD